MPPNMIFAGAGVLTGVAILFGIAWWLEGWPYKHRATRAPREAESPKQSER